MACIYKITNMVTGKQYVGKTCKTLHHRWKKHIETFLHDANSSTRYLYQAFGSYGIDNFHLELIEEVNENVDTDDREKFWIKELNTLAPNGYNMTEGGDGGNMSNSPNYVTAMKIRDYEGEKNPMWGKRGKDNPNFGSKRTEQQRRNIQKGLSEAWNNNEDRKKRASDRISGERNPGYGKTPPNALLLEIDGVIYYSEAEACRKLNLTKYFLYKTKQVKRIR